MTDETRTIDITLAESADLDTVVSILNEAAGWLHARGIVGQWPRSFAAHDEAKHIAAREIYLARLDGEAVGTLKLLWSDPEVWGDTPDDAGYVHGLAVRRSVAGRGIALYMLRWAEGIVAAAGRRFLRLDCWAKNIELCRYYERAGFTSRDQLDDRRWPVALFEKEVT
jgi:ribosomal protein S18 acetylase RimI-like enzyme